MNNTAPIIVAATFLLTAATHHATAAEIDVGMGITKFQEDSETLWKTPGFPSITRGRSIAGEIGITENAWESESHKSGLDLRQGFSYLGKTSIEAESPNHNTNTATGAWVGSDFIGASPDHLCDGECKNLAHFSGQGKTFGFPLTIQPYYMLGSFKISLIGGVFIGRNTWSDTATHIWNGVGYWDVNLHNDSHWSVSPTYGIAIQKGHVSIKYQMYRTPGAHDDMAPSPSKGVHMLSIHYSF